MLARTCLSILLILLSLSFAAAQTTNPYVQAIINLVNIDSLSLTVRELSGEKDAVIDGQTARIYSRLRATPGNALATKYVSQRLSAYGLSVQVQTYNSPSSNVIAVQQGSDSPQRKVIICAHFDDIAVGDTIPGADDNASGTAAVIEAARVLSKYRFGRTIVYALWNEEEQGLIGSARYVQSIANPRDSVEAIVNLDMIAWDSNNDKKADIHTSSVARSAALADTMLYVNATYGIGMQPSIFNPGTGASDHSSFWNSGRSAVMLIESYYGPGNDFNSYYHSRNDLFKNFNPAFFQGCAKLGIGTFATVAGPLGPVAVQTLAYAPTEFRLRDNYPNPFNMATVIRYEIAHQGHVDLSVFDLLGRKVAILVNEQKPSGIYSVQWHASTLPSGIYFYSLTVGSYRETKRMVLLK
jgi:hypothetical protein